MSRFFRNSPPRRVTIPDGNDQPLTSEIDGQRFTLNKGDTSVVDGEPALTIDNDRVSLTVQGQLATTGDTSTVEVNGDKARIVTRHGGSIEAEDTAVEINGDDARVINTGTISGGFNGVNFASDDLDGGLLDNRGTISSDSRAVNIDGEDVTVVNTGDIVGTGNQRNGTIYADSSADGYNISNHGLVDAGEGNQGAGVSLELGDEVSASLTNSGEIVGRGNAAANTPLAGDGIRLTSGSEGQSTFTGRIFNTGDVSSEGANGTVAGIRVANGVGFEGSLVNTRSGTVSGVQNGVYFGNADHNGGRFANNGTVTSDSRAVNLDGDDLSFSNRGEVLGTGDQRNGTVYIDGTGDDISVDNRGTIDAGKGNLGDGVAVQVGASTEDAVNENIDIVNRGTIQGRGQAEFAEGDRVASNGSSGVRFFNGSGEPEATVTGSIENYGSITAEVNVGFLGGLVVEDGVAYDGTIFNARGAEISGPRNGLYIGNASHDLRIDNFGRITSDSRAVNLDGDNVTLRNFDTILGTGDQRNGTVYIDGTGDDISIDNRRTIDAGKGNLGDGISVQVGSSSEDATNENIEILNRGLIQGRGQADFAEGERNASNGSSGVRFFNGSGEAEATVTGSITNRGTITAEVDVGFLGGVVVEDGVAFDGTITNERGATISGPRNGLYIGNAEHDLTIENHGRITSGSRVVNLDGSGVDLQNYGTILGTGDQRNGTVYSDSTADDFNIVNHRGALIDAGKGNDGAGISLQTGSFDGDIVTASVTNYGTIRGRGDGDGNLVGEGIRVFSGIEDGTTTFRGDILNHGTISGSEGGGADGIEVLDVAFKGDIVNYGSIDATDDGIQLRDAVGELNTSFTGEIVNRGRIDAASDGIDVGSGVVFTGDIENHGRIKSDAEEGIDVGLDATFVGDIVNYGTIEAGDEGIEVSAGATFDGNIVNRGIVSAVDDGIDLDNASGLTGEIVNEGTITGDSDGDGNGEAIDASSVLAGVTVINNGTVNGTVLLSQGNDVFDGANGTVNGVVLGNGGEDDLTAGAEGDVLNGGSDNDTLTGAEGDDTFVFERGTDQDTVEEFDVLNDILNLSDFGFADVGEVQAASNEQQIGGEVATVIDLDGNAGADQVTLLGVAIADLNAGNVELDDQATGV